MKLPYKKPLKFPVWSRIKGTSGATERYRLFEDGIKADFSDASVLPYSNHIEMSGFKISSIISYKINRDLSPVFYRFCVFPSLRVNPNDTHGSLTYAFGGVTLESDGEGEKISSVFFNGILSFSSKLGAVSVTRRFIPCRDKKALIEEIALKSDKCAEIKLSCKAPSKTVKAIFTPNESEYKLTTIVYIDGEAVEPKGSTITVHGEKTVYIVYGCEKLSEEEAKSEIQKREVFLSDSKKRLVITTPDEALNRMLEFTKVRASESIFETKNGLMHAPGGGGYYAALWTNDQCEYANPLFAYLGYDKAKEQSVNCYRLYSRLAKSDAAIYTSIIAEGEDYWHGAGDRGDSSMYIYGLCRYLLTIGDKELAKSFLASLETAAEYVLSQMTPEGVVKSDSDELENRFESGNANLSTACLSLDAFLSLSYIENEFGNREKAELYMAAAEKIRSAIESYFGAEVEGYNTYRYCAEEEKLRSWICLPLTVGIFERTEETVNALLSGSLRCGNGILTRSGEKTYWDRSTLYSIRGMFAAGKAEKALSFLLKYTRERLLGEHVPYPVEAYPEGNAAHLSAENALYLRSFTEGILGFRPVGFNSFILKPQLPEKWENFSVESIELQEKAVDIYVSRVENGCEIRVNSGVYYVPHGESAKITLED